jgi:NADPH:quinone reductase-like Zn-dependent oxidoreductase
MKALVYSKQDGTFSMQEVAKPAPKKGEVLIRVHASSINAADHRTMKLGIGPASGIYGADVVGSVAALGEGASRFALGDEVLGDIANEGFGAFAEYVTAPEKLLANRRVDVSIEMAATLPLAGVTALQALELAGDINGKRVLIIGASGGVGTFAVQLAKAYGAEVTGVTSARNLAQTRSIGADFALDYASIDCLAHGERYDRIIAIHGDRRPGEYIRALAPGGTAVIVGGAIKRVLQAMLFGWLYSSEKKRLLVLAAKPNAADTSRLMQYVSKDLVKPVIDRVVPLEKAGEAFLEVGRGHASGKTVVIVEKNT